MHSVCIVIYVSMYLYSYLSTHGISGLVARGDWEQFEVWLKMTIEWTQRYTLRPWSSEFGDAIGDRDWVNSEMHWEAVIKRVRTCTWRPRSSELRDALGCRDGASLEMHLWRPWSSELRDALRGCYWASLEMHLQAIIERDWRWSICRRSMAGVLGVYETLLNS